MRVHIHTYGCQMNERDSEAVSALLARHGHQVAECEEDADVILVNTCSVREKAEDKAIGKLGLMVATKREHPGRIVGVMGCMVQRMKGDVLKAVKGLDFAVGTRRFDAIPAVIDAVREGGAPVLEAGDGDPDSAELRGHRAGAVSAFVNILFGCNRRCTYCIVPDVRGAERSRPAAEVVDEVRQLAARGVREVTLLGQSVMSYGRASPVWPDGARSPRGYVEPLPRLLEALDGIDGLARIRFTSGHPSGCSPELARSMSELPSVCGHLHLPLQSGSDRILKLMRRGYTVADYRAAAARLHAAVPGFALTTDIIVGFPSETAGEFEGTRALMDEVRFDNAFIFKYSPRPGTVAAEWPDDVPDEEKRRRNQELLRDQDRRGLEINAGLHGRAVEVLAEGASLRNPRRWSGRSRGGKIVIFEPPAGLKAGDLLDVAVARSTAQTLYGPLTDGAM